jgi:hypothetical protein
MSGWSWFGTIDHVAHASQREVGAVVDVREESDAQARKSGRYVGVNEGDLAHGQPVGFEERVGQQGHGQGEQAEPTFSFHRGAIMPQSHFRDWVLYPKGVVAVLLHGESTIHGKHLPCDVGAGGRGQKDDDADNVLRVGQPAHGHLR